MNVVSIVGARPQFIKLAAIHRACIKRKGVQHTIIHTQQHYDVNMSAIFFEELGIPLPDFKLKLTDYSLASSITRMEAGIGEILETLKPDMVMVYGDTNSTLAGARAAKKLTLPISHIEAGLRSYNNMPEEFNRVETDKISDLLFCPSTIAMDNLQAEGYPSNKVIFSGDVMFDAIKYYLPAALVNDHSIPTPGIFALATIHRESTVQSTQTLINIIRAFNEIHKKTHILFPVHPRTRRAMEESGEMIQFELIEPVGYLDMLSLLSRCALVLTDSGGLQKEAFFCKKICVTLRDTTEWKELVEAGVNIMAGTGYQQILNAFESARDMHPSFDHPSFNFYGSGNSAEIIIDEIIKYADARGLSSIYTPL